jgi:hypothetical protein
MPIVHLGNPQPVHHLPGERLPDGSKSDELQRLPLEGHQITTINLPPTYTQREMIRTVTHRDGVWPKHSDADRPTWVEAEDRELEAALCEYFNAPTLRQYLAEAHGMPAVHAAQSEPYLLPHPDEVAQVELPAFEFADPDLPKAHLDSSGGGSE